MNWLTRLISGIRVMGDFVVNHVHEDHPYHIDHPEWFNEGCIWEKRTVIGLSIGLIVFSGLYAGSELEG